MERTSKLLLQPGSGSGCVTSGKFLTLLGLSVLLLKEAIVQSPKFAVALSETPSVEPTCGCRGPGVDIDVPAFPRTPRRHVAARSETWPTPQGRSPPPPLLQPLSLRPPGDPRIRQQEVEYGHFGLEQAGVEIRSQVRAQSTSPVRKMTVRWGGGQNGKKRGGGCF